MTPGEVLKVCRVSDSPQPRLPCKAFGVELGRQRRRRAHTQREQRGYGQRRRARLVFGLGLAQNREGRVTEMNDEYFKNKQVESSRKNPLKFRQMTPGGLKATLVSAEAAAMWQLASSR